MCFAIENLQRNNFFFDRPKFRLQKSSEIFCWVISMHSIGIWQFSKVFYCIYNYKMAVMDGNRNFSRCLVSRKVPNWCFNFICFCRKFAWSCEGLSFFQNFFNSLNFHPPQLLNTRMFGLKDRCCVHQRSICFYPFFIYSISFMLNINNFFFYSMRNYIDFLFRSIDSAVLRKIGENALIIQLNNYLLSTKCVPHC